ncbi:MAG: tripartite tricarboxylate transporter TctB family protein [Rhodospirillales bacterium]|nr:tripartite tricarboxylate transporter TctB family protein [Rhodospirillales bacterium]
MNRLNRDTIVAIALLILCGVFFQQSFGILTDAFRSIAIGQMKPDLWPQIILSALTLMCFIYLVQSVVSPPPARDKRGGLKGWLAHYLNPILCYITFLIFLLVMPYLGMLISGFLFVFALMSILGGFERRNLVVNAAVSVVFVGGMWLIFTYGLGVLLPRNELYPYF